MISVFKTDKRLFMDGRGWWWVHIVSDNNFINVVQRFVLSRFERCGDGRKCSGFS